MFVFAGRVMEISDKLEDYLETVFLLQGEDKKPVRIKEIAESLNVNKATVVAAVKKLKDKELLKQEHYGYIFLTDKGKKKAEKIYSRHSILKEFLSEALNVDGERADEEACRMEHVLSEETILKIEDFTRLLQKENISYQSLLAENN